MCFLQVLREHLSLDLPSEKEPLATVHFGIVVWNGPPCGRADRGHQQPAFQQSGPFGAKCSARTRSTLSAWFSSRVQFGADRQIHQRQQLWIWY